MLAINQAQTGKEEWEVKGGRGGRVLVAKNQLQCKQKALCQPVATWVMMSQRKLAQLDMLLHVSASSILCVYIYIHDLCMYCMCVYVLSYQIAANHRLVLRLSHLKIWLILHWFIVEAFAEVFLLRLTYKLRVSTYIQVYIYIYRSIKITQHLV